MEYITPPRTHSLVYPHCSPSSSLLSAPAHQEHKVKRPFEEPTPSTNSSRIPTRGDTGLVEGVERVSMGSGRVDCASSGIEGGGLCTMPAARALERDGRREGDRQEAKAGRVDSSQPESSLPLPHHKSTTCVFYQLPLYSLATLRVFVPRTHTLSPTLTVINQLAAAHNSRWESSVINKAPAHLSPTH